MNKAGSLYEFIKGLSSLRTEDAFRYGEYHTAVTSNNIFSFVREFDGVTGYCIFFTLFLKQYSFKIVIQLKLNIEMQSSQLYLV